MFQKIEDEELVEDLEEEPAEDLEEERVEDLEEEQEEAVQLMQMFKPVIFGLRLGVISRRCRRRSVV